MFKNVPSLGLLICSYLCLCFDFVPQILTQLKSRFAVLCSFTAMGEMVLCAEVDAR